MKEARLEQIVKIPEKCRKRNRFSTVIVKIRNHKYVHVDANATESTAIKQEKN